MKEKNIKTSDTQKLFAEKGIYISQSTLNHAIKRKEPNYEKKDLKEAVQLVTKYKLTIADVLQQFREIGVEIPYMVLYKEIKKSDDPIEPQGQEDDEDAFLASSILFSMKEQ